MQILETYKNTWQQRFQRHSLIHVYYSFLELYSIWFDMSKTYVRHQCKLRHITSWTTNCRHDKLCRSPWTPLVWKREVCLLRKPVVLFLTCNIYKYRENKYARDIAFHYFHFHSRALIYTTSLQERQGKIITGVKKRRNKKQKIFVCFLG